MLLALSTFCENGFYRASLSTRAPSCSAATLTPVAGSPFSIGAPDNSDPQVVTYSPNGMFAAVANAFGPTSQGSVSVYSVDQTTGVFTLISGSPFISDAGSVVVTYSPNGNFVAVTAIFSNPPVVDIFQVDQITGALTPAPGSPFSAGTSTNGPIGAAYSPNGNFLAVTNQADNIVLIYSVDQTTGALTQITGSPYATGDFPDGVTYSPDGNFLAVSNGNANGANAISIYSVDTITGALMPIVDSPFSGGNEPFSSSYSPNGNFLAVVNFAGNNVTIYSVNQATGAITEIAGSPFAAGNIPVDVAYSPNGELLAVANADDNTISLYAVNQGTGALSPVGGSPFATGSGPNGVDFSPTNNFIAITNGNDNNVSVFSIALVPFVKPCDRMWLKKTKGCGK